MKQLTKSIDTRNRVSEIVKSGVISEKEFNILKSRLNKGLCKYEDIEPLFINNISLSADWMRKGLKWLRNLYKTPTGKERKNNPFGYREMSILESEGITITLRGLYDCGRYGCTNYQAEYSVLTPESSFDYVAYCNGHDCYITA